MPRDLWSNKFTTTLGAAVTTAPAAGTVETWTLATTTGLPTAAGQTRLLVDDEIVIATTPAASGTTVSVSRGADGTTPATHANGASTRQIVTRDALASLVAVEGDQTITGLKTFSPASAGVVGLIVQGVASQSSDFQQWRNSAGTAMAKVDSGGGILGAAVRAGGTLAFFTDASLQVTPNATHIVGAIVKGVASQTGDLLQIQNSAGAVMAAINSAGGGAFGQVGTGNYGTTFGGLANYASLVRVNSLDATIIGLTVRGFAAQSADLFRVENSAATILAKVSPIGDFTAFGYGYFRNGMRIGEIYSDGGLYRDTGNMKFSASTITFNDTANNLRGTFDSNGLTINNNLYLNNGIAMNGNWVIDTSGGWHRSYGATGWYNSTYAGGWWMNDSSWIRSYGGKSVCCERSGGAYYTTAQVIALGSSNSTPAISMWGWNSWAWLMLGGNTYCGFVNLENSAYIPVWASQFGVGSAAATKFDMVPLAESPAELRTKFKKLRPIRFKRPPIPRPNGAARPEWTKKNEDTPFVGFTAEEMDAVFPEAVLYDETGAPGAIDYSAVTAVLVRMLIDVDNRLDRLEAAGSRP